MYKINISSLRVVGDADPYNVRCILCTTEINPKIIISSERDVEDAIPYKMWRIQCLRGHYSVNIAASTAAQSAWYTGRVSSWIS